MYRIIHTYTHLGDMSPYLKIYYLYLKNCFKCVDPNKLKLNKHSRLKNAAKEQSKNSQSSVKTGFCRKFKETIFLLNHTHKHTHTQTLSPS